MKIVSVGLDPDPGDTINAVAVTAMGICRRHGCVVKFTFNGTKVFAYPGDSELAIIEKWSKARK